MASKKPGQTSPDNRELAATTPRIEMVSLDKLRPYENNARTHSPDQIDKLRASLREFGFVNPILIDADYGIIAGHGRLMAARAEGMETVPCVWVEHLTEAQKKAYILADNRLAEDAGWDFKLLSVELEELKELDFDIGLTGFGADELSDIFGEEELEAVEDDFDIEPPEVPVAKRGDIYQLGRHRLMCGDSTVQADVDSLMAGALADIVFTDPPWNVDYGGSSHPSWKARSILNDHMKTEDFNRFLCDAFAAAKEVSKPGCMTYIVMSPQEWGNIMDVLSSLGYHWSSTIIWRKDSLVLSRKDYHRQYEPIWYGWLDGDARVCPLEDRKQSDVWDIDRPKKSEEHPTMKPVELVARAITNSSKAGSVALDLFGGSGTTLIAAEQTGRTCHMMELDPKYCDVIVKRWEEFTGEKAVLVNGT